MKFLEKYSQSHPYKSAIIMEEGDYNLTPNKAKGMQVDYVFIPEVMNNIIQKIILYIIS